MECDAEYEIFDDKCAPECDEDNKKWNFGTEKCEWLSYPSFELKANDEELLKCQNTTIDIINVKNFIDNEMTGL